MIVLGDGDEDIYLCASMYIHMLKCMIALHREQQRQHQQQEQVPRRQKRWGHTPQQLKEVRTIYQINIEFILGVHASI
jgi:hypothetical protein